MQKAKAMMPFLTALVVGAYSLLSLALGMDDAGFVVLFFAIPLFCLLVSILYGMNYSFDPFFAILATVLFLPFIFMLSSAPIWIFIIGYGITIFIGTAIGRIFCNHSIKIRHIEKIGQRFMQAVLGCCIVIVAVSAIMISQMKQITYKSIAYGLPVKEVRIDFASNTATRRYYDSNGEPSGITENPLNRRKEVQIKTVCAFSLLPIWPKRYYNPWVMDGDCYNIVRSYENSESTFCASNAYPPTYWFVYEAIDDAVQ